MSSVPPQARRVVAFWRAAGYPRWFANDPTFDALTRMRLGRLHREAAAGRLDDWDETPDGALALLILLDQAPRNLFRGTPRAFGTDARALAVAEAAITRRLHLRVTKQMRWFFALPFEHAEDACHQARAIRLFEEIGDPTGIDYAKIHADIIARFGRFPHRNAILGRISSNEEKRFLSEGGFSG